MTLWMILRIGRAGLGLPGDNLARHGRPTGHRAQPTGSPSGLSTPAVHDRVALTCTDTSVPRIHRTYYDYHSSLSQHERAK